MLSTDTCHNYKCIVIYLVRHGIWLSVIFGNSDYKYVFIDYSEKYFTTMMKHVKKFWEYVEQDEQPRVDDEVPEEDCTRKYTC